MAQYLEIVACIYYSVSLGMLGFKGVQALAPRARPEAVFADCPGSRRLSVVSPPALAHEGVHLIVPEQAGRVAVQLSGGHHRLSPARVVLHPVVPLEAASPGS